MKIGFIGTGKISSAVIEAICTSTNTDYQIFLSPRSRENSERLAANYANVKREESNQEVVDKSELVCLALRPPIFEEVLSELIFREDQTVVSFIPFSGFKHLQKLVQPAYHISRATPLPTVVTHQCPIPVFNPSDKVMKLLSYIGQPFEVNTEEEMHTIWTLTCLISPFYDMMKSLSRWSTENAVQEDIANKYVADMFHTLTNAAHLQDNPDFNALSHHAATPGGLNERAAKEIMKAGAQQAFVDSADNILEMFKGVK